MPLLDIQRGLREVGRIRCGDQVVAKNGKSAPRKLDRFRFTADDNNLLAQVANLYGGEVTKWEGAPVGDQWQVYTTAERIPVAIAPGLEVLSQWHELWSGGGCQRRCDGQTEQLSRAPCICLKEGERQCKPTTRLSVILPEVPGLGVWRLESHGYYAARELGGQLALVDRVVQTGGVVIASLRLTFREDRRPGQPIKRYSVPALDVSQTFAQLAANAGLATPPAVDGTTSAQLEHLYQPNTAATAADAAAHATMPTVDDIAAAERTATARHTATRAAKNAKPALGTGRQRNTTPTPPAALVEMISEGQKKAMFAICKDIGLDDRDDRMRLCISVAGHDLKTSADMTYDEAGAVLNTLSLVQDGRRAFTLNPDGQVIGTHPHDHNPGTLTANDVPADPTLPL
jgi:hypothetical protein